MPITQKKKLRSETQRDLLKDAVCYHQTLALLLPLEGFQERENLRVKRESVGPAKWLTGSATTPCSAFPSRALPTSHHAEVAPSHQSTATELRPVQTGLFISQAKRQPALPLPPEQHTAESTPHSSSLTQQIN